MLMAMGDKTEKATPKRRRESREKGQVARSNDLSSGIMMLTMFGTLNVFGGYFTSSFNRLFGKYLTGFSSNAEPLTINQTWAIFIDAIVSMFAIIIPVLLSAVIFGVVSNYLQVGFLSVKDALQPKLNKINPLEGFKRMFSLRSLVELVKSILKFTVLATILYKEVTKNFNSFPNLMVGDLEVSVKFMFSMILAIALKLGLALLIIGVFDYLYQWWDNERKMRMSKQEVKDEFKQVEGDPKVKGKIRQKQMQMGLLRMMSEVSKADFVVTNPTHYAIAIKYDDKLHSAPVVLAKGKDFVAKKIKEKAKEHNIEMIENRPLAQALYATVEIGEQIPSEFYAAIAEILVYIYSIRR